MTNQIDELMALADEYAKAWHASQTSRLIAAYDDGDHRKALKQALEAALKPDEELTREQWIAVREGHFNAASSEYFGARPQIDTAHTRRIFYAGHCRGYEAAPPAQTPPPRLTCEEVRQLCADGYVGATVDDIRTIETAVRRQFGVNDE